MNEIDMITEIRGFNRFYTNILGVLDQHILHSGYSLTEARIIFEISKIERCTANQLCAALDIDRSYMSRIIKKFEEDDLVIRHISPDDSRNMEIRLSEKGNTVFQELNDQSNQQIGKIIAGFDETEREELIHAIRTVKRYFSKATKSITIRPFRTEDVEYVIDRQLSLYASERKFTSEVWTKYLTQGVWNLVNKFEAEKDTMLIAECDGNAAGCIAVTHTEPGVAQLRYFFLEPEVRGMGVGTALLNQALAFCREKEYSRVFLWTVSAQESARKLYKNAGFVITETSENDEWGSPVVEERWDVSLSFTNTQVSR